MSEAPSPFWSSALIIKSPACSPARTAGLSGKTFGTKATVVPRERPSASANSGNLVKNPTHPCPDSTHALSKASRTMAMFSDSDEMLAAESKCVAAWSNALRSIACRASSTYLSTIRCMLTVRRLHRHGSQVGAVGRSGRQHRIPI